MREGSTCVGRSISLKYPTSDQNGMKMGEEKARESSVMAVAWKRESSRVEVKPTPVEMMTTRMAKTLTSRR